MVDFLSVPICVISNHNDNSSSDPVASGAFLWLLDQAVVPSVEQTRLSASQVRHVDGQSLNLWFPSEIDNSLNKKTFFS
jgi:hypothetical protein